MAFVEIRGLKKEFRTVVASDIDHLEIAEGEFVSLLGPSGCGKTTTLRCIAGSIDPDSGSIFVRGREITHVPIYKRKLGLVFQDYALFPHMTVFDNVSYGLRYRDISKPDVKKKVSEALELVGLAGFEDRYPHQLSGGQQQRVAFARSVVYEPDVLLLDEPLSNLDFKLRKAMRFELKRMQRQLKITTIFVTHDQQEALSLSDRIVVMNQGRIEQVGTPNEIYENPVSVFVADFIGSTNIIRGVVTHCDADKGICAVRLAGSSTISIPFKEKVKVGEEINFIIKPEKVGLGRTPRVEDAVKGEISGASYLGSAFNYEIRIGDLKLEVLDSQADYRNRYEIGESIFLTFDPEGVKVLRK
ncbi:MAG: ABC transporter ATP-binding protein [Thermodesulfobacteriota bacterium]